MLVQFDPIGHVYRVDGQVVASVTSALKRGGYIPASSFYTAEGRDRGTRVHHATMLIDTKRRPILDIGGIEGEIAAYRKFLDDFCPVYTAVEVVVATPTIAGRVDRVFRRFRRLDRIGVLEIKTGACADWHGYQTAGYAELIAAPDAWRGCLHLRPDGKYRLCRHRSELDRAHFLHALNEELNYVADYRTRHA